MFTHICLNPHDPFAEREVSVAFEIDASGIRLLTAMDENGHDILPDLIEVQRNDLRCEVAAQHAGAFLGSPRSDPLSPQASARVSR
jgi:hypothetical protein